MTEEEKFIFEIGVYIFFAVCFLGTFIFGHIMGIYDKRRKKDSEEKTEFYFGRKSFRFGLKEKKDISFWDVWTWFWVWGPLYILCAAMSEEKGLRSIFVGLGEKIDDFPAVMLSGIGAITMLGAFVGFKKDTWVGLNIDTVIKERGITRKFKIMLILVLKNYACLFATILMKNSFLSDEWYLGVRSIALIGFICYLVLFVKILKILIDIMIGEQIAGKRLRNLYQEFWYMPLKKVECNGREEEIAKILVGEYVRAIRKIKLKDKKYKVSFDTNVRVTKEKGERYNKLKVRSSVIIGLIYLVIFISFAILFSVLMELEKKVLWVGVPAMIVCVVNGLFYRFFDGAKIMAICMVYGRHGYEFWNRKEGSRYVREVPFIGKNKYYKFVRAAKNVIAFFLIYLRSGHNKVAEMVMDECEEKLKKNPKDNVECYILLVVMDYLYKQERKYLELIHLSEDEQRYYTDVARAFAIDVNCDYEGSELDFDKFNKYVSGTVRQKSSKPAKQKRRKGANVQIKVYR